ncbi:MAG: hypothetical protein Q8O43_05070 [Dehalococcoidia bacterium]|nr:hypothetical protein [Dehalococcoidia bacterium]
MGTSYSGGGNVPVGADWLYLAITTPPVTLTVNTTGQGSVAKNPDQATYTYGTVVTLTATPAPGWSFSSWGGDLSGNTNPTTITVNSNKAVTASFAVNTYVITASVGTNGSITPSGSVTVNSGAAQTFTISANTGYHVADVLVDGSSVGAVTSYTFNNVTANHTIAASFAINTYTPTPTPSPTTPTPTTSGGRSLPDPSSYVMVGSGLAAALLYLGVSRLRRRLNRSR